ncbi:histone methylation protein DOT1-domain-containing protein [Sporodiniella umbellata]|nr:histone methylation protein DOT1-domain-containing protein [Sporodiniella umbellata]
MSQNKTVDFSLRFLLLKPCNDKKLDEYHPVVDLIRSINLMLKHCLVFEEQNQLRGIVSKLKKYNDSCFLKGFKEAVVTFNYVMRNARESRRIKKCLVKVDSPDYDLTCHILHQIYSRTVAWRVDVLKNYMPFSDQVYGEIFPPLVNDIISKTRLQPDNVFMDLGCGIGNVVLQVAAQTKCDAYGIEIMTTPCKLAKRQLKEYAARMKAWCLPTGRIWFLEADFLKACKEELESVFSNCDVILINNHSFQPATNHALVLLFSRLREGTRIVSLSSFVPKNHTLNQRTIIMPETILEVEKFEYKKGWVSWTSNSGSYYIATVNRSRLSSWDQSK